MYKIKADNRQQTAIIAAEDGTVPLQNRWNQNISLGTVYVWNGRCKQWNKQIKWGCRNLTSVKPFFLYLFLGLRDYLFISY